MKRRFLMSLMGLLVPACSATNEARSAGEATLTSITVDVDGIALRVVTAGLADRKLDQPVIIFESGGGAPLETWEPILAAAASIAPLIAYDRSGTGRSAWDSLPPTPDRVGSRLRALLQELRVAPPYVLVGHSWGGALVRYFAGAHPEHIAGVLYIDPTDITQTPADELAVFNAIGAGAAARDAFHQLMERSMSSAPAAIRAEAAVIMSIMESDLATRGLRAAPDVPTSVIVAGRLPSFPANVLPFDTDAYAKAMNQSRVGRLRSWVKNGGTFVEASKAGHIVHADDPGLVIDAIEQLMLRRR